MTSHALPDFNARLRKELTCNEAEGENDQDRVENRSLLELIQGAITTVSIAVIIFTGNTHSLWERDAALNSHSHFFFVNRGNVLLKGVFMIHRTQI